MVTLLAMPRQAPLVNIALLLFSLVLPSFQQQCKLGAQGELCTPKHKAEGVASADATAAFKAQDADPQTGFVKLGPGTFRIASNLVLEKPVVGEEGSVLQVEEGVELTLMNQPQHPYTVFFTGNGKVTFSKGCYFVVPEWFGASGKGDRDDSQAVQRAVDSTKPKRANPEELDGPPYVYLQGTYGIGPATPLVFQRGVVIQAEPGARFVAFGGNRRGITFTARNHGVPSVLPHLSGFEEFCVHIKSSMAALTFRTLENCGDAIRIEAVSNVDSLDNTVYFDSIKNSRVGVVFHTQDPFCKADSCVFQGNHVKGKEIRGGPASGPSYAILFRSPSTSTSRAEYPAWDSNHVVIASIVPPSNPDYRVFDCKPACNREVLQIGSLAALPAAQSRVFGEGLIQDCKIEINHAAPLQEFQFGLRGDLNLVELFGELTPKLTSEAIRCTNGPNSKNEFNNGKSIYATYATLQAVPNTDWLNNEARTFYFYHQLATGDLNNIKFNSKKTSLGLQSIHCLEKQDQGGNEVRVKLINLSGGTVKAGEAATFTISVATLNSPP